MRSAERASPVPRRHGPRETLAVARGGGILSLVGVSK